MIDLPAERPGHAAPPAILAAREAIAGAIAAGNWRTERPPIEEMLGGVRVLRFRPVGGRARRARLLHFHGGGYRMGAPEMVGPYAESLANNCNIEILCPAYRQSPDHPFPAAVHDGLSVLSALTTKNDSPIILSGDSAGGGLAASLTAVAIDRAIPIAALILLSPWLDLRVFAPSYIANAATDPLFSTESASLAAALYLEGQAPEHPLASPLFAPLDDFPPVFLSVGEGEVLLDDAAALARRLQAAGRQLDYVPVAGMTHTAVVRGLTLPGAAETFGRIVAFVDRVLKR